MKEVQQELFSLKQAMRAMKAGSAANKDSAFKKWYMQEIGFAEYWPKFVDNGFDEFDCFEQVKKEDLDEMGVKKGHQRKMLKKASDLNVKNKNKKPDNDNNNNGIRRSKIERVKTLRLT